MLVPLPDCPEHGAKRGPLTVSSYGPGGIFEFLGGVTFPYGMFYGDGNSLAAEIAAWDAPPPSEEPKAEAIDECSHFTMTPNTGGPPVRITCRICAAMNAKLASAEARVRELEAELDDAESEAGEKIDTLEAELAELRGREPPEKAWARGWRLGFSHHSAVLPEYQPPAPAQPSRCTKEDENG